MKQEATDEVEGHMYGPASGQKKEDGPASGQEEEPQDAPPAEVIRAPI